MNIAVRYYSKSGHTKALAHAIASAAGVEEVSVDQEGALINSEVDVLFIGGAVYAYGIDNKIKDFLKTLKKENVKKAVVFSTSWISKHAIALIKKALVSAGIEVVQEFFYARNKPSEAALQEAEAFAKKFFN